MDLPLYGWPSPKTGKIGKESSIPNCYVICSLSGGDVPERRRPGRPALLRALPRREPHFACGQHFSGPVRVPSRLRPFGGGRRPDLSTAGLSQAGPAGQRLLRQTGVQQRVQRGNGGYKLIGSSIRLCQENGTWSGEQATCQMRSCAAVPAPKNGRIECTSSDYVIDSECAFSCDVGFTLVGSRKRVCLPIGYWDGLPAFCKRK